MWTELELLEQLVIVSNDDPFYVKHYQALRQELGLNHDASPGSCNSEGFRGDTGCSSTGGDEGGIARSISGGRGSGGGNSGGDGGGISRGSGTNGDSGDSSDSNGSSESSDSSDSSDSRDSNDSSDSSSGTIPHGGSNSGTAGYGFGISGDCIGTSSGGGSTSGGGGGSISGGYSASYIEHLLELAEESDLLSPMGHITLQLAVAVETALDRARSNANAPTS